MIVPRVVKPTPLVWGILLFTEGSKGGCVLNVIFGIENRVSWNASGNCD